MHHERSDGSGYHRGATAKTTPVAARVLAAADVFHALVEPRPYRAAFEPEEAAREVDTMVAAGHSILKPRAPSASPRASRSAEARRQGPGRPA